ncbi:hypothetical protein PoB_002352500, partial [Plakobranchus ocellatus]
MVKETVDHDNDDAGDGDDDDDDDDRGDESTSGSSQPPTRKLLSGFPQPCSLWTRIPCIDLAFDKALQNFVCLTV